MHAQGMIKKSAATIDVSFRNLDSVESNVAKVRSHNVAIDANIGGISDRLKLQLNSINVIAPERVVVSCYLHTHMFCFNSPIKKSIILDGNKRITLLQLLHTTCAVQEECDISKLMIVWKHYHLPNESTQTM